MNIRSLLGAEEGREKDGVKFMVTCKLLPGSNLLSEDGFMRASYLIKK